MIPKIESSDLIGENRNILATKNMNQPIGITLDIKTDKLYWVDKRLKTIEVMSLDGSGRRLLVKSTDMVSFRSIAVFQVILFYLPLICINFFCSYIFFLNMISIHAYTLVFM